MVDVPNTFVPGETARAGEVNENFTVLASAINSNDSRITQSETDILWLGKNKAKIDGDSSVSFNVGPANSSTNAVSKGELMNMLGGLMDYISGLYITKDTGATPSNKIIVANGFCYDTTKTVAIKLDANTPFTNTGQQVNTRYYVFLSVDENGGNLQCLFGTNSSPTGLAVEYYRCIGYYETDASNDIIVNSIKSYGTNQSGNLDSNSLSNIFVNLYPAFDASPSKPKWNSSYVVNTCSILSSGHNWKIGKNGWIRWVCNEQNVTRDLKIGLDTSHMLTVARARAEAANDASGTAALVPIKAGMYAYSSKDNMYFYPCVYENGGATR
jgi:hypothetical protein